MQKREGAKAFDEIGEGLIAPERRFESVKRVDRGVAKSGVGEIGLRIDEAGRIAQKVADSHRALRRFKLAEDRISGGGIGLDDRHILEFRQILRHGGVEVELAFIDQHHGGDAGDLLGHRSDTKNRIRPHRIFLVGVLKAGRLQIGELSVSGDRHDKTGGIALLAQRLKPGGHALQPAHREAETAGIADRLQIVGMRRAFQTERERRHPAHPDHFG